MLNQILSNASLLFFNRDSADGLVVMGGDGLENVKDTLSIFLHIPVSLFCLLHKL